MTYSYASPLLGFWTFITECYKAAHADSISKEVLSGYYSIRKEEHALKPRGASPFKTMRKSRVYIRRLIALLQKRK